MSQAHGSSLWQEPAGSGATPAVVPVFLVKAGGPLSVVGPDSATVEGSLAGPEQLAYGVVKQDGEYTLLDLAPIYAAASGADLVLNLIGPSAAIFADGGGGNLELTTDLTRAPVADLYADQNAGGNRWLVRRPLTRLRAVQVRGAVHLY